ncbi:MAG: endolytic transglycosylase MltG [Acidobacteriota bacterium]
MSAAKKRGGCLKFLLGFLLLAGFAAGGAAFWAWQRVSAAYQGFAGIEVTVDVASGSSAGAILAQLERAGVLRDARLSGLWLQHLRGNPPLRAGEYRFSGPHSTPEVLERLIHGEVLGHPVTLVEGLSLKATIAHLAEAGFGDLEKLRAAAQDPSSIHDLDPAATDLEGYLFPDTYSFPRHTPEIEVIATLVRTFRKRALPAVSTGGPRTLRQILTLGSIVEKEAKLDTERPLIAAVYANRLRIGMGLYADPTVIYALERRGGFDGNLRRADLGVDDPYNTYRYPGLPPGPICSPGLASLAAAAHPATAPYLYFVSRNDGSHVFANTLAEHNRNVDIYQKRYWRERWAAEKGQ